MDKGTRDIQVFVDVVIPIGLVYDETPTPSQIRADALVNFLDHPAIRGKGNLRTLNDFATVRLDHTDCTACIARGWILADNTDHGLRIERCDACNRFLSDAEAVVYVSTLAKGESETMAVIESSRIR